MWRLASQAYESTTLEAIERVLEVEHREVAVGATGRPGGAAVGTFGPPSSLAGDVRTRPRSTTEGRWTSET